MDFYMGDDSPTPITASQSYRVDINGISSDYDGDDEHHDEGIGREMGNSRILFGRRFQKMR
jgi:hypothetical protein